MSIQTPIAYLAGGKLFLKRPGADAAPIESQYAQEVIDDAMRSRQRNEWKTRSQTGRIMSGGTPWGGGDPSDPSTRRVEITGVTQGPQAGALIYALEMDRVGGLFSYDVEEAHEQRLYHHNQFRARHLARDPMEPRVAFSLASDDGGSNIAVIGADGRGMQIVTEGDSLDEAPSWVPESTSRLVFQSAGLGRNQAGHVVGTGPSAVQQLDLDREDLTTLLEDDRTDYLLPRMTADGILYCIRRPYQVVRGTSVVGIVKDALLLPVRLLWAVFGFLNFFSLMFSGKPLTTAGGPKREGPDPRHLLLWGKVIDAERAEKLARDGEAASLVPKDWKLIKRTPSGEEHVVAEGVVSFDLTPDGGVIYTNGSAVFHVSPQGRRETLCRARMIEHVAVA